MTEQVAETQNTSEQSAQNYGAGSIRVLEGLEGVRMRPGMYIGDTDDGSGLHHMILEVVDNAIDEALAGYCDRIDVTINEDESVSVTDNGRGIPVDMHPDHGRPAVEIIMTELHAGGKFDQNSYKVSGGLHGVGVSVVNALSSQLDVRVTRGGTRYAIRFQDGAVVQELHEEGEAEPNEQGTEIRFWPSWDVFTQTPWDANSIKEKLQTLAFLNAGITIAFQDKRQETPTKEELHDENGIAGMVRYLDGRRSDAQVLNEAPIHVVDEMDGIGVEVALEWTTANSEKIQCFTNNIYQRDGGQHMTGLRSALSKVVGNFAAENQGGRSKVDIDGTDVLEGLTCVLSVKVPDPKFSSQTKDKLVSSEVRKPVARIVGDALQTWIDENPDEAKKITNRVVGAARAREAAKKARDTVRRKTSFETTTLPGKLADCQSRNPKETELFIVEGDSAGGSAKSARERRTQAILPVKGKILNTEDERIDKILDNDEVSALVNALGTGIGDEFNPEKLRYNKIIIMTDADVDGAHIRCLLLTFLHRHMQELVRRGHVYIAEPPLYRVARGKQYTYLRDEEAMNAYLISNGAMNARLEVATKPGKVYEDEDLSQIAHKAHRYTGLIEALNADIQNFAVAEAAAISGVLLPKAFENQERMQSAANYLAKILEKRSDGSKWTGDVRVETVQKSDEEGTIYTEDEATEIVLHQYNAGVNTTARIPASIIKRTAARHLAEDVRDLVETYIGNGGGPPVLVNPNGERRTVTGPSELFDLITQWGQKGINVSRYKGLGEMNPDQLWETTLEPENRNLVQVEEPSDIDVDTLFATLMGRDTGKRRQHIVNHATEVQALDI